MNYKNLMGNYCTQERHIYLTCWTTKYWKLRSVDYTILQL